MSERRVHAFAIIHDRQEVIVVRGLTFVGREFPPERLIRGDEPIITNPEPLAHPNGDNFRNPCLRSDTGVFIWGIECFWGDSERFEPKLREMKGRGIKVRPVAAEEFRTLLDRHVYSKKAS